MAMSSNAAPHVVEDCLGVLQLLSDGTVLRSDFPVLPTEAFPDLPAVVLSADYRLAPEHRLPATIDDGAAVLSWLRTAGVDPWLTESADFSQVFVSGEPAGANIAHHLAVRLGSDGLAPVRVAGCILLTPFFGGAARLASESRPPSGVFLMTEMSDQFCRLSLPEGADRDHSLANPFSAGSSSLEPVALPPVLVVAAGRDLLRDRVLGYAERLKAIGKVVELADFVGEEHGFFVLQPWGEAGTELIRVMRLFIHNGANAN
ncbi:hypothetical protein QOZ80_1AG0010310 [Eleusine coracana subsp. coracana]|nr:hypothetical protein QOZ80_1AG0010310 [Eleusine coracana subsp. coracana]